MFEGPPGSYDICEICFWEDDALQLEFATTLAGGANGVTLEEAQRSYMVVAAKRPERAGDTRSPRPDDERDAGWRPIDRTRDEFAEWDDPAPPRVPEVDERLYYWRPTFWRRGQAT
jgi:hypothetical protein